MTDSSFSVPDVSCGHCKAAIEGAVSRVPGVRAVVVDLERKRVTVSGDAPDDAIRAAIDAAGYAVEL